MMYLFMLMNNTVMLILVPEYDQYDHLNYTRPNGSWKPHYQRMSSALKDTDEKDEVKPEKSEDNS